MSDLFLASYLRECLQVARRAQDAYDAAILLAPDDRRKHQMVRFAEQSRMRVDILLRVIHQHGFHSTEVLDPPVVADGEGPWWQHVRQLWAAEDLAHQQIAMLQTIANSHAEDWITKAIGDLAPSLDERLHVLQA
ncbi:MAG: hypothetical protein H7338_18670, partial [Candidatus Sericytochromatia bacterium]|nr:hypothetical protein [Candidatus Sericytochromatia bacterium]